MTTDLPFARDICGEAALYFPPNDAAAAAERIARLAECGSEREGLVRKGEERFASAVTPDVAFDMFLDVIERTARGRG